MRITENLKWLLKRKRYGKFGGGDVPKVSPAAITPTAGDKSVTAAKDNLREKLRRQQGRAATQLTTPGMLKPPDLSKPYLKDSLG